MAVTVLLVGPAMLDAATARPVSEAERAAVALAADYLVRGSVAWEEALASDAYLAGLSQDDRRDEIEVRLGPPQGAHWTLATPSTVATPGTAAFLIRYPSGLEEFLELDLVEKEEEWRLRRILSSVDPRPAPVNFEELFTSREPPGPATPGGAKGWPWSLLALLVLGVFLGGDRRVRSWRPVVLVPLLLGLGCGGDSGSTEAAPDEAGIEPSAVEDTRLGALRDARWRILGANGGPPGATAPAPPAESAPAHAVQIWRAEELLVRQELAAAGEALDAVPAESRYPRAELLRARLALARHESESALDHFTKARRLSGTFDTMLWEMVEAQVELGETGLARATVAYLAEAQSRRADVHYVSAYLHLEDGVEDRADEAFRMAWNLEPKGRKEIFTDPRLAAFAARPTILPLLELGEREEPSVVTEDTSSQALILAPVITSALYGRFLVLHHGDSVIEVPNGAPIAPRTAVVGLAGGRRVAAQEAALQWLEERDVKALALASPIARRRAELAGQGLMEQARWEELLDLSDRLLGAADAPSIEGTWLRVSALRGLERYDEAKALLISLAKRDIAEQQRDPIVLMELAELFAQTENFDTAIRLLERAAALGSTTAWNARIRQFRLDQRLAESYGTLTTDHFEVRFPRETGEKHVAEVAWVLEEELRRLQRWIAFEGSGKIEVHMFPAVEFIGTFGVLGLFDGKVRVPLADLQSLHPSLVAILSHEVAHAMIDRASAGRAPSWLHEGLAQHIQMAEQPVNYLAELRSTSRAVALPVLEPILRGFAEPQFVQMAYSQAAWLSHYLEVRFGAAVFGRLFRALARGLDTAAAIEESTGVSFRKLEDEFWKWGTVVAPKAWPTELRRYDKEMAVAEMGGLHPARRRSRASVSAKELLDSPDPQSLEEQMRRWHRRYSVQAAPIKSSLGKVLGILDGRSKGDLGSACRDLGHHLDKMLGGQGAVNAPDRAVAAPLRLAFTDFRKATVACQSGAATALQRGIDRGEAQLAVAAKAMARYGMAP